MELQSELLKDHFRISSWSCVAVASHGLSVTRGFLSQPFHARLSNGSLALRIDT
jgi:hypothetical protein